MVIIDSIIEVWDYIEKYDGIVFDLDDTLYSEKDYVRSGYKKIAKFLDGKMETEKRLWELFESGKNAIDELLNEKEMFSPDLKMKLLEIYRNQMPDIMLYLGVGEMLRNIKDMGKKLGLITDGRVEGQRNKIRALRLEEVFSDIIITDELGGVEFRKPNPQAYIILQKKWKIPFERMVYIGDNTNKDFIAPNQLGMGVIWFRNPDGIYVNK